MTQRIVLASLGCRWPVVSTSVDTTIVPGRVDQRVGGRAVLSWRHARTVSLPACPQLVCAATPPHHGQVCHDHQVPRKTVAIEIIVTWEFDDNTVPMVIVITSIPTVRISRQNLFDPAPEGETDRESRQRKRREDRFRIDDREVVLPPGQARALGDLVGHINAKQNPDDWECEDGDKGTLWDCGIEVTDYDENTEIHACFGDDPHTHDHHEGLWSDDWVGPWDVEWSGVPNEVADMLGSAAAYADVLAGTPDDQLDAVADGIAAMLGMSVPAGSVRIRRL